MKRIFYIALGAILFIGVALVWLGNEQNAPAADAKTKDLTTLDAADIMAYRWEAMAKYYEGSPAKDLSTLDAANLYYQHVYGRSISSKKPCTMSSGYTINPTAPEEAARHLKEADPDGGHGVG